MSAPQTVAGEARIASLAAKISRSCGDCSLCCKLFDIEEPELGKPANKWCPHCRPGRGCTIYESRPDICRGYACDWLTIPEIGDEWYPRRSKMIVGYREGRVIVQVDPAFPSAWLRKPYYGQLKEWARHGFRNDDSAVAIQVVVGRRSWWVLPGKDIELTEEAIERLRK